MSCTSSVRSENAASWEDFHSSISFIFIRQTSLRGKPTGAAFCFPLYFYSCYMTKEILASYSSLVALEKSCWESTNWYKKTAKGRGEKQHLQAGHCINKQEIFSTHGTDGQTYRNTGKHAHLKGREGLGRVWLPVNGLCDIFSFICHCLKK